MVTLDKTRSQVLNTPKCESLKFNWISKLELVLSRVDSPKEGVWPSRLTVRVAFDSGRRFRPLRSGRRENPIDKNSRRSPTVRPAFGVLLPLRPGARALRLEHLPQGHSVLSRRPLGACTRAFPTSLPELGSTALGPVSHLRPAGGLWEIRDGLPDSQLAPTGPAAPMASSQAGPDLWRS